MTQRANKFLCAVGIHEWRSVKVMTVFGLITRSACDFCGTKRKDAIG